MAEKTTLDLLREAEAREAELLAGYQEMRAALVKSLDAWDCVCSGQGWDKDHLRHAPEARATLAKYKQAVPSAPRSLLGRQDDAVDAERWRALLACGRIRIIGTAGVNGSGIHDPSKLDPYGHKPYGNYVHFGAEFWSVFPDQDYYKANEKPEYARATLTEFADATRAAIKAAASEEKKGADDGQ